MSGVPLFLVDAFTSAPFRGNPAAVCLLPEVRSTEWMQQVAAEMNQAETAFLYPDAGQLRLRWLTPTMEVDLCGHATLATAHVVRELANQGELPEFLRSHWNQGCLEVQSRSGVLTAESAAQGIRLDFPATPISVEEMPAGLPEALSLDPGRIRFFGKSAFDYLVEVESAAVVRGLRPDFQALGRYSVRGVIVTAVGDAADHDFLSRFFGPAAGVNEDPVTGSAHCALAPFWAVRFGRETLFGFQASQRGGHVRMELRGERVRLSGQAVTVSRGTLLV